MSTATAFAATTGRLRSGLRAGGGRTQVSLMTAQLLAGLGNLVVSLIAARVLDPGGYADAVTFLGLYLVVHVPAAALSASGALEPGHSRATSRTAVPAAIAAALMVAALSPWLGAATGLGWQMVVILAGAFPGAVVLGLARGEAYARHDVGAVARSLLVEPLTRAILGLVLMVWLGAPGAALAAVTGGYLAWWVCRRAASGAEPGVALTAAPRPDGISGASRRAALGVGWSFVAIALVQIADLVVANARLEESVAGGFGAVSALGGAAAFATATVPLVLLPASARGDAAARRVALQLALATGTAITIVGLVAADPILTLAAGDGLAGAAPWLGPYLMAMSALGVARVQVATRWTQGDGAFAGKAVAIAALAQVVGQLALGTTVAAVVMCTLAVTVGLSVALAFGPAPAAARAAGLAMPPDADASALPHPADGRSVPAGRAARRFRPEVVALAALCAVAAVLRLASPRGLWVDEAISVRQAQMGFTEMLVDMRSTDVHPPLHHAVLWVTVRLFGTSEFAVRLPSVLAGIALVPAMLWTGRVIYDRRTGWVAAGLAAIAPFCVWYSQEARMYSLFMLFATLALGAQVQAIRRGHRRDWLLYAAATAALVWTQYFALLPVAVQQLAFALVAVRRRRTATSGAYVRQWLTATALVVAALLPLVPILHDQFTAYTSRSDGLVPGQAGAASSTIGGTISVYAIGANLIWAVWGYHADGTMVQLTALWPLLMLLALVLLGRRGSPRTWLLAGLVIVPMVALFGVGAHKRDLFELRYFAGAVPVVLLLGARLVTVLARARATLATGTVVAVATMSAGLVDQQLNGANPRLYDFEGALAAVAETDAGPDAVLLYEPVYLGDVIDYYAPDLDTRPLGSPVPAEAGTVWVLAAENVLDDEAISGRVGHALAELDVTRDQQRVIRRPNVRVWELR